MKRVIGREQEICLNLANKQGTKGEMIQYKKNGLQKSIHWAPSPSSAVTNIRKK